MEFDAPLVGYAAGLGTFSLSDALITPRESPARAGHGKVACSLHVYRTVPEAVAEGFGVPQTGCGLCPTGVPCERRIPGKGR